MRQSRAGNIGVGPFRFGPPMPLAGRVTVTFVVGTVCASVVAVV